LLLPFPLRAPWHVCPWGLPAKILLLWPTMLRMVGCDCFFRRGTQTTTCIVSTLFSQSHIYHKLRISHSKHFGGKTLTCLKKVSPSYKAKAKLIFYKPKVLGREERAKTRSTNHFGASCPHRRLRQ
jgi:hypothetical protein